MIELAGAYLGDRPQLATIGRGELLERACVAEVVAYCRGPLRAYAGRRPEWPAGLPVVQAAS